MEADFHSHAPFIKEMEELFIARLRYQAGSTLVNQPDPSQQHNETARASSNLMRFHAANAKQRVIIAFQFQPFNFQHHTANSPCHTLLIAKTGRILLSYCHPILIAETGRIS